MEEEREAKEEKKEGEGEGGIKRGRKGEIEGGREGRKGEIEGAREGMKEEGEVRKESNAGCTLWSYLYRPTCNRVSTEGKLILFIKGTQSCFITVTF